MDLILWRHAEAVEVSAGEDDLQRMLTPKGEKQAARMAGWLDRQLPEGTKILCSPALRCQMTAMSLGRKIKVVQNLNPSATPQQVLSNVSWPSARGVTLVVGHQPWLGQTIAQLLKLPQGECSVRKGALWWLHYREREQNAQTVVVTVQSPDLM
jgi:phosphohistidine phosphatase